MSKNKRKNQKYLLSDKISLNFVEKDISHYLSDVDYEVGDVFKQGKKIMLLEPILTINDKDYSGISLFDVLFNYNVKNYNPYGLPFNLLNKYSFFYPFSCSCGEPSCAGIWNGIRSKERKYTIEWRLNKKDGYGFLEKTFYSFSRDVYETMVKDVLKHLVEKLLSKNVVYVLDDSFQDTLADDLKYWIENHAENKNISKFLKDVLNY